MVRENRGQIFLLQDGRFVIMYYNQPLKDRIIFNLVDEDFNPILNEQLDECKIICSKDDQRIKGARLIGFND